VAPPSKIGRAAITVNITSFSKTFPALIDTGSSLNLIDASLIHRLDLVPLDCPLVRFTLADNSYVESKQKIFLPVKILEKSFLLEAQILPQLPYSCILGMTFLVQSNATLIPASRTISFPDVQPFVSTNPETPSPPTTSSITSPVASLSQCTETTFNSDTPSTQPEEPIFVTHTEYPVAPDEPHSLFFCSAKTSVNIKAQSEILFPLTVPSDLPSSEFILEKNKNFRNDSLAFAPALFCSTTESCFIRIANVSHEAVSIFKDSKIVSAIPVEPQTLLSCSPTDLPSFNEKPDFSKVNLSPQLSPSQRDDVMRTIQEFPLCFPTPNRPLGKTPLLTHSINLKPGQKPIHCAPFHKSYTERLEMQKAIDKMLKEGLITESTSPWSAPVLLVKKPNGSFRLVTDFRRLNKVTERDMHPLPRLDDALNRLHGCRYFSSIDLSQGFHQIPLDTESRALTGFSTPDFHGEYTCLPMGINNGPSSFCRLMTKVLKGLLWKVSLSYLDDIILFTADWPSHLDAIHSVLSRLQNANLVISPPKCFFGFSELKFLGHIISASGIRPNPEKIKAVRDMPVPADKKKLRAFLGLTSFFRRFVKNYSTIAKPLYELTKDDVPFVWNSDTHSPAFNDLKTKLITAPILAFPDFSKPFSISTDASFAGIGALLKQHQNGKEVVIAYCSRTLSECERKYPIVQLECLAVIYALAQFRPYIYGLPFQIFTDCSSLRWLMTAKHSNNRLCRWALKIQDMDATITYKPGRLNSDADALSRNPVPTEHFDCIPAPSVSSQIELLSPALTPMHPALEDLSNESLPLIQAADPFIRKIIADLSKTTGLSRARKRFLSGFVCKNNILCKVISHPLYVQVPVVPASYANIIIPKYHDDPASGHQGFYKTLRRIHTRFWWRRQSHSVESFVKTCASCQTRNPSNTTPSGTMFPIRPGSHPFSTIHIDKLGPFPTSNNKNVHIIIVVDTLTRFVVLKPIPNGTAAEVAKFLWHNVFLRYGCASRLISDRGTEFLNQIISEITEILRITHKSTSAYNPRANGTVERFNRVLGSMVAKFVSEKSHSHWDQYLDYFAFAHNTSIHSTLRFSPFFLLHGFEPIAPSDLVTNVFQRNQPALPPVQLSVLRKWILDYLQLSQDSAKSRFDATHPLLEFFPGDFVMIKRPQYTQGLATKLLPKRILAIVLSRISDNNYRIQYVHSDRVDIVHVQHISLFNRRLQVTFSPTQVPSAHSMPASPLTLPSRSILTKKNTQPILEETTNVPPLPKPPPRYVFIDLPESPIPVAAPRTSLSRPHPTPSVQRPSGAVRPPHLRPRSVLNTPSRFR
jgi:hypothetical protein